MVSPVSHIGGAEKNLVLTCKLLVAGGWRPVVVLPEGGELTAQLQALQVTCVHLKESLLKSGQIFVVLWAVMQLWWKLRRFHIDVIHANSIFSLYVPVYLGFIWGKKVWVTWADFDARAGDVALVNVMKRVGVFAVSRSTHRFLLDHGMRPDAIQLLYNGTEKPQYLEDPEAVRRRLGLGENDWCVGITGRIDGWKGHRTAILAFSKLSFPNRKLIIMGSYHLIKDPGLKADLESLITELNLTNRVVFTGYLQDPASVVNTLDVVICPSDYEPFGLVAIEAMALAKPVVASDVGGLSEIVLDGETGFLVPPKNSDALAEKLALLADNALAKTMGKKGQIRFEQCFTTDVFWAAYGTFLAKSTSPKNSV
ncbi:MAG: glycosyltransferase [Candidatus Margulisiibacteriota bacterium]